MSDALEQELRSALSEKARTLPPEAHDRLAQVDYRAAEPGRRRVGPTSRRTPGAGRRFHAWPALGGVVAALGAGIAALVLLLSSGATPALAGWTPVPTTPSASGLARITKVCRGMAGPLQRQAMRGRLVLTDQRGSFVAELWVSGLTVGDCTSDGRRGGTGGGGDRVLLGIYAKPGPHQLGMSDNGGGGALGFGSSNPNAYGFVRHAFGLTGKDVTAVSFRFTDGSKVEATVEHGWYFAWWPNMNYPVSVRVTTTTGTIVSRMPNGGEGQGCKLGTRGCVWAGFMRHPILFRRRHR